MKERIKRRSNHCVVAIVLFDHHAIFYTQPNNLDLVPLVALLVQHPCRCSILSGTPLLPWLPKNGVLMYSSAISTPPNSSSCGALVTKWASPNTIHTLHSNEPYLELDDFIVPSLYFRRATRRVGKAVLSTRYC